jgi:hypothetical protein
MGEILVPFSPSSLHQRDLIGVVEELELLPKKKNKKLKNTYSNNFSISYFKGRKHTLFVSTNNLRRVSNTKHLFSFNYLRNS